jgi:hypothetical protein
MVEFILYIVLLILIIHNVEIGWIVGIIIALMALKILGWFLNFVFNN